MNITWSTSSYRAWGIYLAYVVGRHASACPRTMGVDASRGEFTLGISCDEVRFKVGKNCSLCRVTECKKFFPETETICNLFCSMEDIHRSSWPLASTFSSSSGCFKLLDKKKIFLKKTKMLCIKNVK